MIYKVDKRITNVLIEENLRIKAYRKRKRNCYRLPVTIKFDKEGESLQYTAPSALVLSIAMELPAVAK